MKIILLEDVKGLGKKSEVKEVKSGYAKNFLIPKNLAKLGTEENIENLNRQKTVSAEKENKITANLKEIVNQLKKFKLELSLKTGENKQVFGSIGLPEIKKALKNSEVFQKISKEIKGEIKDFKIILEKPIKALGEHFIEIGLGKGIKGKIKVDVRSQS